MNLHLIIQEDQGDSSHERPIVMSGLDNQKIKQALPNRKPPEQNRAAPLKSGLISPQLSTVFSIRPEQTKAVRVPKMR